MIPVSYYIILSLALFTIGLIGVVVRRNIIIMLICVELMLNSANLLLVAFSKMHAETSNVPGTGINGQIFVLFVMVVAAAEVAIGLSIMILFYRKMYNVDVRSLNQLKH